jgi:hypothetical protein
MRDAARQMHTQSAAAPSGSCPLRAHTSEIQMEARMVIARKWL